MTTTVKITALTDIGANLAGTTLVPVVNMAGTPTTERANVNNIANYVLNKATGANLGPVANVKITGGAAGQVLTTNGSNVLSWATISTTYGNSNVANYLPTYTGNIGANVITANLFSGNGSSLRAIVGANVTGFVPNANVANTAFAVAAANVSGLGNIATININGNNQTWLAGNGVFANIVVPAVGNIAIINLDGNGSNVLRGNGVFAAVAASAGIANGTSNVTVPVSNGNINLVSAGNTTMVITGTGANITGNANVSGNANVGNLGTAQVLATANVTAPQLISNIATGTAPLMITSTTRVANLNVDYANVADNINVTAPGTGTGYVVFANATTGNIAEWTSSGITSNLANNSITATTFVGALANGNSNVTIPTANGNVVVNIGTASYTFSELALNVTTNPPASPAPTLNGFGLIKAPEFNNGTSNITINANSNTWVFSSTGNLILPANTFSIYFANGSQAALSSISNGNSNVSVATSNGNVTINAVGNATMTVTGTGANITGTLSVSSNANVGNLGTGGLITATGNITGGNLTTSGNLVFSPTQIQSSAYAGGNGHSMMIDTNRTDTYVEIGTADKPFKTFAAAIAAVATLNPTGSVPYTFILMGCNINETVDFTSYNFNFITISTTCRSTFNNPVIFGNSNLLQVTIRNVEFGNTVAFTGDGTANQFNNISIYNVSFVGALTVTAVNAIAFYEAAFFAPVVFNNVNYCYVNGGQFNDDWTIRSDDTGSYPIPSGGAAPGVILALDFIANDINFIKGGTGTAVFQPHSSRMGRSAESYTLPAGWIISSYSSVFIGTWTNNGTWTMRNSSSVNAIAGTAPTYSGTIGGSTAILTTGNITTINSGLLQNGNSNITLPSNGNVSIQAAGSTVELVVTSTGANINGTANVTGNANVGNLGTTTAVITTGNITTINSGLMQNGNSNITITSNGNISLSAVGAPNEVVITATGVNVAGTLNVTGNITGNTNGFAIGYLNIPQVSASNATLALTDAGKHYYSTTAGNLTLTIPLNSSVAFATGTAISIVVQAAGNVLVNAASGVTLYMGGNATAGNRVVSTYGMATLMKVASDTWFINGTGVA
jgi:hypothetical protein